MSENFQYVEVKRDTFAQMMENSRKEGKFTDVQLKMGDKLFRAHRAVLALYSPVLEALISDQWSTTNICPLSDESVDPEIMEDLLSFLYTGKIKLTPENAHPLCVAAHFLQITGLIEPCAKYLCRFITFENVLTLFEFATTCELEALNFSCLRFVKENVEKVFESAQVHKLLAEFFNNLIVGLKDHFSGSVLREHTFRGIVGWIEKDAERLKEVPVLLANIPLEELSLEFLTKTVSIHPLVKESSSCIETVSTALAKYETYSRASKTRQNLIVIGGQNWETGPVSQTMSCYDSRTKVWRQLPNLPTYRDFLTATVINQQDIIVGGGSIVIENEDMNIQKPNKSLDMFDWAKQAWTKLPDIPFELDVHAITTLNENLYIFGLDEQNYPYPSKAVCYSFQTKQWKEINTMNIKRENPQLIAYKNGLYALCGNSFAVEYYDAAKDKWTIMENECEDNLFGATLHQNKIYVRGDYDFQMYDPETDVWTSLPEPEVDVRTSLVSMNNKLLAVGGGLDNDDVSGRIYEFDPSTQEWSEFDIMDKCRAYHRTLVGAFY